MNTKEKYINGGEIYRIKCTIVCLSISNFLIKSGVENLKICGIILKLALESDSIYTFKINL